MKPPSLLEMLCSLANPENRMDNADKISQALGAGNMMIFLYDSDIDQFLPAEGFPQTIPRAKAWQTFLRVCQNHCIYSGSIVTDGLADINATAINYQGECILVLEGADPVAKYQEFTLILPMLSALLHREQSRRRHTLQLKMAEDTTVRAQALALKIDMIRHELQNALSARDSEIKTRKLTEQSLIEANAKLMKLNHELQAKQSKLDKAESMLDSLLMQSRSYDQ
jgi:hypothetical protein